MAADPDPVERQTGISSTSRRSSVGSSGGAGEGLRRCSGEGGYGDAARAGQEVAN